MNKKRSSYHTTHPSFFSSPVLDTAIPSNSSQQIYNSLINACHQHSSVDGNHQRNNHNNTFIQDNEILPKKRRIKISNEKPSLLSINILLILIRLMILLIMILIISYTFYSSIVYIYSKPKKNEWERIIDWFFQE